MLDLARTAGDQYRFALEERLVGFASDLAQVHYDHHADLSLKLTKYRQLSRLGRFAEADAQWADLEKVTELGEKAIAAHHRVLSLHLRGELTEDELRNAEELNRGVGSALGCRDLCALRGWWLSDAQEWLAAKDTLNEAVALAHKVGKTDRRSEIRLALARHHLGEAIQLHEIADQFSRSSDPSLYLPLALLWLAAGDGHQAGVHATAAYKWAWADGAPYIHWYECERARALLAQLGATVPAMPSFNSAQSPVLPWEADMVRAIRTLLERWNRPAKQKAE
jgi:hypothetical protein